MTEPHNSEQLHGDTGKAALTALSALLGWVTGIGFLAPIVCWLIFRENDELCDEVGRVQFATLGVGLLLIVPFVGAYYVVATILVIVSAVKAHEGIVYRPPLRIQFFAENAGR